MQQAAREAFKANMLERLAKKPWIAEHRECSFLPSLFIITTARGRTQKADSKLRGGCAVLPDFAVACRRLTPGPGYLEALCSDNVTSFTSTSLLPLLYHSLTDHCTHPQVEFIPTHIRRVTPTGIDLVDGTSHTLDVLICATGYDTSYHYPFPMYGIDSQTLTSQWHQDSPPSHPSPPSTYLSICTSTLPNYFFSLGPNSAVGSGSLLALIEAEVGYAVEVGLKMQRERVKRVVVRREAVEDYMEYVQVSLVCGF